VIVVGSGIGGLTAGAMLAKYGYSVVVLESHDHPGGAAHGFSIRDTQIGGDFHFDTGPSFFSGLNPDLPARASNPMRTVLDALDEGVPCVPYDSFGLLFPEGNFLHTTGFGQAGGVIEQVAGQKGVDDWRRLMKAMEPLAEAVDAMPTAALRTDAAAVFTTGPFLSKLASLNPLQNLKLTTSFQRMVRQAKVKSPFVQQWLDLLCFCLSGLPADGTITAEMALMLGEFYRPTSVMDTPVGGAFSLARALVRGLEKYGGTLACRSHVDRIDVDENGRAIGVTLRKNGRRLIATQAVISNMSVWDLYGSGILNVDAAGLRPAFVQDRLATPVGKSFMHLHVGFRATRDELATLQAHYMHMEDWSRGVTADQNAVLVSIPSVHDDTMAPDGYAVLHAYTPATEDYARWAGLDRKSMEYGRLKLERSQFLWNVLERIMPDIRQRAVHVRVGTPLTHERFLRRHEGSYGPALHAERDGSFPWAKTPVDGLLTVGDSNFPGIGVSYLSKNPSSQHQRPLSSPNSYQP
jgi:phytoene dehydrogenase-like protein